MAKDNDETAIQKYWKKMKNKIRKNKLEKHFKEKPIK